MEGGHDALGENPGAEGAGRLPRDAAIEDELHLVGPAQVEILAHDFFEEAAAGAGPIEDLGQGEFRLEDRELVAIAGAAMRGREGMREAAEPLADEVLVNNQLEEALEALKKVISGTVLSENHVSF